MKKALSCVHLMLLVAAFSVDIQPVFAAGELDLSFGRAGVATLAWSGGSTRGTAVLQQSTGKVIVAVEAQDVVSGAITLIRLNPNGSLDTTFADGGVSRVDARSDFAHSYALTPSDDILIGNQLRGGTTGLQQLGLVKVHRDTGQLVGAFGQAGFVELPAGFPLLRLNNGQISNSECTSHRVAVDAAGDIFLSAGCRGSSDAVKGLWLAKLDGTTGASKPAFGVGGVQRVLFEASSSLPAGLTVFPSIPLLTSNGDVIVAVLYPREFTSTAGGTQFRSEIAVLKASASSGVANPTFGSGGVTVLPDIFYPAVDSANYVAQSIPALLDAGGFIYVSGSPQQSNKKLPFAKLDAVTGSLVAAFGNGGISELPERVGSSCSSNPLRVAMRLSLTNELGFVVRFNDGCREAYAARVDGNTGITKTDGSPDGYNLIEGSYPYSTFPLFVSTTSTDGGLVLFPKSTAYTGNGLQLTRLLPDWKTVDQSFAFSGTTFLQVARTLTFTNTSRLQSNDGSMFFAGSLQLDGELSPQLRVARMTSAGLLDTTFGVNGLLTLNLDYQTAYGGAPPVRITEDRRGDLFVLGLAVPPGQSVFSPVVAKFSSGGTLNSSFGQGGYAFQTIVPRTLNVRAIASSDGSLFLLGENDGPVMMGLAGRQDIFLLKIDPVTGIRQTAFGASGYVQIRGTTTESQTQYSLDSAYALSIWNSAVWVFGRFQAIAGGTPTSSARFAARFDAATGMSRDPDYLRFPNTLATSSDAFFAATVDGSGDRFVANQTTLSRHFSGSGLVLASFGATGLVADIAVCGMVAGRRRVFVASPQAIRAFDKSSGNVDTTFGTSGSIIPSVVPAAFGGDCSIALDPQSRLAVFGGGGSVTKYSTPGEYCELDVDSSGGSPHALTDGLLIVRAILGLDGAAVGAGIVTSGAEAIANDVRTMALLGSLDVDGDGFVRPESDGLLLLRILLGFRGNAVTSEITDSPASTATRKSWISIATWLSQACNRNFN